MSKILIIAEHLDGKLNFSATAKCVSAARAIPDADVHVLVLAADATAIAADAASIAGVSKVITVNNAANAHPIAQVLAPQIAAVASGYSHVLANDGARDFELLHKPYSVEGLSRALRSKR